MSLPYRRRNTDGPDGGPHPHWPLTSETDHQWLPKSEPDAHWLPQSEPGMLLDSSGYSGAALTAVPPGLVSQLLRQEASLGDCMQRRGSAPVGGGCLPGFDLESAFSAHVGGLPHRHLGHPRRPTSLGPRHSSAEMGAQALEWGLGSSAAPEGAPPWASIAPPQQESEFMRFGKLSQTANGGSGGDYGGSSLAALGGGFQGLGQPMPSLRPPVGNSGVTRLALDGVDAMLELGFSQQQRQPMMQRSPFADFGGDQPPPPPPTSGPPEWHAFDGPH